MFPFPHATAARGRPKRSPIPNAARICKPFRVAFLSISPYGGLIRRENDHMSQLQLKQISKEIIKRMMKLKEPPKG